MEQHIELGLTEEKLQLEIEGLKQKNVWDNSVGKWIPVITALIAVLGFLGGIIGYVLQQRQLEGERVEAAQKLEKDRADAARALERDRAEADRKLEEETRLAAQERQDKAELAAKERESRELLTQKTLEGNRLLEERRIASQKKIADDQNLAAQKIESDRRNAQQAANLETLRAEITKANEARTFESQRPYREKQIELYFEASRAASTIATSSNPQEKAAAEAKFWNLYWGPLSVVEDTLIVDSSQGSEVEKAMVIFGRCSMLSGSDPRNYTDSQTTFNRCSSSELKQVSLCLAHTVRDAIHSTWGINSRRMTVSDKERCNQYAQTMFKPS